MGLNRCPNGHLYSERKFGNVCPYCDTKCINEEINKKDDVLMPKISPVCGWIVCISGVDKGKDYKIKSGNNFVGQADDMDIRLPNDKKILMRNHCTIEFDPDKKKTMLLPGNGEGIYHNNSPICIPTELKSYDTIVIGDSKFIFISLCGEKFMWED